MPNLVLRVMTGIVLGVVSLYAISFSVWTFAIEATVLATAGIMEFCAMARRSGVRPHTGRTVFWGLLMLWSPAFLSMGTTAMVVAGAMLTEMAVAVGLAGRGRADEETPAGRGGSAQESIAVLAAPRWIDCMTTVFIALHAWLFSFAIALRRLPGTVGGLDWGAALVFLFIIASAGCDAGAFFAGRLFGRRALMPAISPRKTVEGALGGVLFATALALVYAAVLGLPFLPVTGFTVVVAAVSQVGDLWESLLKRESGVKDSGRMMVGHGGVLDRVDSFIYAAPVSYMLAVALLPRGPI